MKRKLLATAAVLAFATSAAQAQSSVTLYGLIDAAVEYVDNIGPAGDSVTRMATLAGSNASRWGMRGTEDLGGGLKAVFTLESGFAADSGIFQQGGRLFGRQAFVGVSGSWGQVSLGRQYGSVIPVQIKTDPFLASAYGPAAPSGDTYLAAGRHDNAIVYSGKFGGLTVHALYSLGRDAVGPGAATCAGEVPGDSEVCRSVTAGALYEGANNGWGIGGWYDAQKSVSGVGSDDRYSANGYLTLGPVKLFANFMRRDNDAAPTATPIAAVKSNLWSVGASYPIMPQLVLDAMYYDFDLKGSDNDSQMIAARISYKFSKRTDVYFYTAHLMNDGAATKSVTITTLPANTVPLAGENQTGVIVGLRHTF